jgi:hypothetical protein
LSLTDFLVPVNCVGRLLIIFLGILGLGGTEGLFQTLLQYPQTAVCHGPTDLCHKPYVEGQVVEGVESRGKNLSGLKEMAKIGPAEVGAGIAGALRV